MTNSGMTNQMKKLFFDIVGSLGILPEEQRCFLFGDPSDEDMECIISFANYITLEYIKYSFDHDDPEYSVRHFIGKNAEDYERMLNSRIMQYVLQHKKEECIRYNVTLPDNHRFADSDMSSIEQKLKGHRITEMNYYEFQNIHDLEIIKSIAENRIESVKKVSNERFQDMFERYDKAIEKLIETAQIGDTEMVMASLEFFTLESTYALELLYNVATYMEEENIDEIDVHLLRLLCCKVSIESQFGGTFSTDSRMVKERSSMIIPFFGNRIPPEMKDYPVDVYKELIVLIVKYKEIITANDGDLYKDWFRKNSSLEDWASFFRCYNVFECWQKKEWTRTKIRNMRKLIDMVTAKKF